MSLHAKLIRQIAELAEDDVRALLTLVERLRARPEPSSSQHFTPLPVVPTHHPERFGTLRGSVRVSGDVEAPVSDAEGWTFDAGNVGS